MCVRVCTYVLLPSQPNFSEELSALIILTFSPPKFCLWWMDRNYCVNIFSPLCNSNMVGMKSTHPPATLIALGYHVIGGAPTEGGGTHKCGLKVGSSALRRCVSWNYCWEESQPEGKTDTENRVKIRVE